jgi:hypothetical protein
MTQPEERSTTDAPPEEREEEGVDESLRRAAPIDEDVAGELNAALPDDPTEGKEEEYG